MEFKKLQSDMVAAMKARDKARKDTISSLISAVKKLAIDEGKRIGRSRYYKRRKNSAGTG